MHSRSSPLLSGPHARTDLPDLLLVEPEEDVRRYGAALRAHFRVTHAESTDAALHALERTAPALVVADLALPGTIALSVCHAAKRLAPPPKILVTTTEVRQVPDAIIAGCDAVLLKPFAPNLLFARVGRLLRARAAEAGYPLVPQPATFRGGQDGGEQLVTGTNQHRSDISCPACTHRGVVSFEFTSYRRAWYACLECRHVWLARRLD